jgi:hypothetical protein
MFTGLKKSNFDSKNKVVSLWFTEKRQFVVKIDLNSVFPDSVVYILDRLYIVFLYIKFYRFLKKFKIQLKN